jgi:hypothetical protein
LNALSPICRFTPADMIVLRPLSCRLMSRREMPTTQSVSPSLIASPSDDVATWRENCPSLDRPAPLSMDAARDAARVAARRHELKLREAAAPGTFVRTLHDALASDDGQFLSRGDLLAFAVDDFSSIAQLRSPPPTTRTTPGSATPGANKTPDCQW